jgi:hypothetical protein
VNPPPGRLAPAPAGQARGFHAGIGKTILVVIIICGRDRGADRVLGGPQVRPVQIVGLRAVMCCGDEMTGLSSSRSPRRLLGWLESVDSLAYAGGVVPAVETFEDIGHGRQCSPQIAGEHRRSLVEQSLKEGD